MTTTATKGEAVPISRANAIRGGIQRWRLELPMRLFSGEHVEGHCVTKWRNWLLTSCDGVWFAVLKTAPTAMPKAFSCSLATVKIHLLNGNVVCNN